MPSTYNMTKYALENQLINAIKSQLALAFLPHFISFPGHFQQFGVSSLKDNRICLGGTIDEKTQERHKHCMGNKGNIEELAPEIVNLRKSFETFIIVPNGYVLMCDLSVSTNIQIRSLVNNAIKMHNYHNGGFGFDQANLQLNQFGDLLQAPAPEIPLTFED